MSGEWEKAVDYNTHQMTTGVVAPTVVTELVRYWQEGHDLEADGMYGPVTRASVEGALPVGSSGRLSWEMWDGPQSIQPKKGELVKFFGIPGHGELDRRWYKENIVECHRSLGNQLPGVPSKWWVKIHQVVEPYLREALRRAAESAPEYKIVRIGGFVFRHKRHDPTKPLSTHSWGVAVDINPRENFSRRFRRGEAPVAWSDEYMAIWPNGVPRAFVEAFQSCGFAWGSDWDEDGESTDHRYYDPMHFEWIARDGRAHLV